MKKGDLQTFQFGNFVLEAGQHSLKKGTQQIHLRPKAFETLLYLVKHHGSLVKKQDMLDDLWPNVIVTENTLSHCIDEVRRALKDDAQEPTFIRTIPRVGFKFIAEVKELKTDENKTVIDDSVVNEQRDNIQSEAIVNQGKNQTGKKRILVGMIVIILITLLTGIVFSLVYNKSKKINSIAVLPFMNLNIDPNEEYFADGMTETLISNLGKVKSLKVISRTSVMTYKNTSRSLPEIARQLNVDAIVEGSVLNANGHVRVTAKLIKANTDKLLWVKSYKRDIKDIMKLQGELAHEITSEIKLELTPEENISVTESKPVNPKAYIAYLKGRYFWNMRTSEGFKKAEEQFLKAITIDSGYAPAYSGLSDTYILQGNYGIIQSHDATLKAKRFAAKALELNNTLAEA
ncbi:MAG: FlgO family outer membrane protein, partial [Ignavibacteriaceae bacterium]